MNGTFTNLVVVVVYYAVQVKYQIIILTCIWWSQVEMIDGPASERGSRKADSSYNKRHCCN